MPSNREKKEEEEEFSYFKGTPLINKEKKILETLEQQVGSIPVVEEIEWNTFGVVIQDNTITGLGLYEKELNSLPESISGLENLQVLDLRRNQFNSLPESIRGLKNLQYLNLGHNQLTSLPESISRLENLQYLNLSWNKLTSLPESMIKLDKLEHLWIEGNNLDQKAQKILEVLKKNVTCTNETYVRITSGIDQECKERYWIRLHGQQENMD